MKILIATFTFPPQVGGVAEVARTQAAGFAARGHQITVATCAHAARTDAHAPPGVTVRQFDICGHFLAGTGYHGEIAAYQQFLVAEPTDFILFHCWQSWALDLAIPLLPRVRARKLVVSHGFDAHLWNRQTAFPWGLGVWLKSLPYVLRLPRMMRAFDRLVFLSEWEDAARFYDVKVAMRLCPERVSVIPNGVHLEAFKRRREDFRKTHGIATRHLLLNVANYCDRKNQLATQQDFMAANRADATLVFIGGEFNEYSRELRLQHDKLRRRFPEARVLHFERIPKEEIYAAYQATDVFILGAKQETQPLAILDAMAASVPFISTNTGCVAEFPGGVVAPTGERTTKEIHRLLDDVELRRRLGAEGSAACASKYDWERVMDAYERLFSQLARKT